MQQHASTLAPTDLETTVTLTLGTSTTGPGKLKILCPILIDND